MSFFLKDHSCFQLIKIIYIEHLWKTFLSFYFFQLFSIYKSSSNFVSVQFTNITKKPVLNECKTIWSSTFHASSFSVVPDSLNTTWAEISSTWNKSNDTYTFMVHIQTSMFDMNILTFTKRLKNSSLLV